MYDLIIIGSGPVGETIAFRVAAAGLRVAVVEHELVGGDCHYYACMPSKALIRSGNALRSAQHVDGASQAVTSPIGVEQVLKRRNRIVDNWVDDKVTRGLTSAGIDVIRGEPQFTGKKSLKVVSKDGQSQDFTAKHAVVVATGSDAMIPDIEGIDEVKPWNNRQATSAQKPPKSLLIIGGGAVACEMATAWSTLGSKVTLTTRDKLLNKFEPFAGELVGDSLSNLCVDLRLGIVPVSAIRSNDTVTVTFNDGSTASAAEILIATGRSPRTDLGFESVGFPSGEWLQVDDTLLVKRDTNSADPWLYALGDANNRVLLQHQGKYQARVASNAIIARAKGIPLDTRPWGKHVATADIASVPQVVFTDPEVASVGLTEAAAIAKGYQVKAVEWEIGKVVGAFLHADGYKGRAKAVVDEDRRVLVGMTYVGSDVADLLQAATVAIVGEVPLERLWHAVPPFPTISEIWLDILRLYDM